MTTTFKEITHGSPEWADAVRLREKILREPLGSRFTDQELEKEKYHFQIAGYLDDTIVATAVLVPEGDNMKMQRVVVTENLRRLNIGTEMMTFCETFTADKNFKTMYCHARNTAVNFYIKNGYIGIGDYFDEDGIPHLKMSKELQLIGHLR
jgi:predicted GNAT family N-acyltransferase